MQIKLSDYFTYKKLLRFVIPSIVMMVFTSVYNIVDGIFVSNFVGKTAFASIAILLPVLLGFASLGLMFGTGGTAIIGKTLGEQKPDLAKRYFSTLVYLLFVLGLVIGVSLSVFIEPVAVLLGAGGGELLNNAVTYGRIVALALPLQMLQMAFENYFIVAEKPKLGLIMSVLSGVSNIALDALFVIVLGWGIAGAAWATALSLILSVGLSLIYFARPNTSLLRLTLHTKIYAKMLIQACVNGSSSMVDNIAASLVAILYNYQLIRFIGESGVAAYGVIGYICFVFAAIFIGYTIGVSSIISYKYGAHDATGLKNIFRKSITIICLTGVTMFLVAYAFAPWIVQIFVGYDPELYALTLNAIRIISVVFLFQGFAMFGSALFTALNNGKISAIIAFMRTFVFEMLSVILLPIIFGPGAIWWALVVCEIAAFIVAMYYVITKNKTYGYIK